VTQVEETDPDVLRPGRCLILTIDSGVAFSRRSIPPFSTSCMRDTRRHPCERVCLRVFLQHLQAERTLVAINTPAHCSPLFTGQAALIPTCLLLNHPVMHTNKPDGSLEASNTVHRFLRFILLSFRTFHLR
ncbi:hypothetical protein GOODEAATRI_033980, partial [Goodea atripinnis]